MYMMKWLCDYFGNSKRWKWYLILTGHLANKYATDCSNGSYAFRSPIRYRIYKKMRIILGVDSYTAHKKNQNSGSQCWMGFFPFKIFGLLQMLLHPTLKLLVPKNLNFWSLWLNGNWKFKSSQSILGISLFIHLNSSIKCL